MFVLMAATTVLTHRVVCTGYRLMPWPMERARIAFGNPLSSDLSMTEDEGSEYSLWKIPFSRNDGHRILYSRAISDPC